MSARATCVLILVVVFSILTLSSSQTTRNQGVRLANSTLGSHAGRVEVKYYGRWGTICDIGWSYYDARVICGMLNFTNGYICAIRGAPVPFGEGTGPVWLTNLRCRFYNDDLDQCSNNSPHNINPCEHSRDAALICQDPSVMPIPNNVTVINSTTRSVLLRWNLDYIPSDLVAIDFGINYTVVGSSSYTFQISRQLVAPSSRQFYYTFTGLSRNTSYSVKVRADGEYQWCPYNELVGNYSDPVIASTNATIPPSTLPMRLVSPGTESYIGRFQVQHDGVWGNVCDDLFDIDDANVACYGLNYTEGAICYATSTFPQSAAPILLDDVNCRNADRFEDCLHSGWRIHNCASYEAIGLVCNPGDNIIDVPVVRGLRAVNVAPNTITIAWNVPSNVRRYRIYVIASGEYVRSYSVYYSNSRYTMYGLTLGRNYTINITAAIHFGQFRGGNCYGRYVYGAPSEPISVVTKESPPKVAIRDFHVTLLNSTAVEVTWNPPTSTIGINGDIRGYKLFTKRDNMNETFVYFNTSRVLFRSRVYIFTDLQPGDRYCFSILMFTVGDGPRSVKLCQTMPNSSFVPLISTFGKYGDGLEVRREYTYRRGFNVLCGSNIPAATYEWRYANGSSIGISNRGFRAAHFQNGTAVLQIGTALIYTRSLTLCDGGVYTCVAADTAGRTEMRNFTLTIGSSQPTLSRPQLLRRGSTWIQLGWNRLTCDGGYPLQNYIVQYRPISFYYTFTTVAETTVPSYTVKELDPNTRYTFRIGRASAVFSYTRYSLTASYTTLIAGPSPPLGVVATVNCNSEVCVRWRPPALPVGSIILYYLYAEPVANSQEAVDSINLPDSTILKTFPGNLRSACTRLNKTGVIYHFQMSAVAISLGRRVEGTLSPYSSSTTLLLPNPGIQTPVNLTGSATNTTVTLQWSLPCLNNYDVFNVSYSGMVERTVTNGACIEFLEQGWMKTRATSLTFSYLTPSTNYDFSVAVVTDVETGPRATTTIRTATETGAKFAFFQIRILKIEKCIDWVVSDVQRKVSQIVDVITAVLSSQCRCQPRISQEEFSCRTGPSDSVVFRARVSGTSSRSASDMAAIIMDWVLTNSSSVTIDRVRYHLDPNCNSYLECIHGPDCEYVTKPSTTTTTLVSTTSSVPSTTTKVSKSSSKPEPSKTSSVKSDDKPTDKPTDKPNNTGKPDSQVNIRGGGGGNGGSNGAYTTGLAVGLVLGALILGLVITLVLILAFMFYQKGKGQSFQNQTRFKQFTNAPDSGKNTNESYETL